MEMNQVKAEHTEELITTTTRDSNKYGNVVLDSIDTIVPAIPTKQPCWVSLTNLDRMLFKNSYLKYVHFYRRGNNNIDQFDHLVSNLKQSLSKVLVDHYVFAGRLQNNDRGETAVNCNDAGIKFRVAHTQLKLDDWEDSIEEYLNAPDWLIHNIPEAPFFHIQVTQFACGGIAVGLTCTELVVDGYSGSVFQKSWADINRGMTMLTVPIFKPELLKARVPPVVSKPVRDYVSLPADVVESYMDDTAAAAPTSYSQQVFVLTSDSANGLIREIESGPDGYGTATSFEALAALFWKSMTEARGLADADTTKFAYTMSLRGGRLWQPKLPPGYFGNAVHTSSLPANAGHVRAKHVSYAARLIHEDILGVSAETVKSCIDWMESEQRKGMGVTYNFDVYGGKDVNCTSLHIFPVYDIDFGWGRPVYFSLGIHAMFGDLVFILPSALGGKNREIYVQMRQEHMSKLLNSTDLLRFVTPTTKKALLKKSS